MTAVNKAFYLGGKKTKVCLWTWALGLQLVSYCELAGREGYLRAHKKL